MNLEAGIRRVLEGSSIAHLATVSADGSPHVVPVFVGMEGEQIAFFTDPGSVKGRHLQRDSRVALSIAPLDDAFTPVAIRGRVTEWVDGDQAWPIIDRIAMKYTGQPYSRELRRAVALIEPEWQALGVR